MTNVQFLSRGEERWEWSTRKEVWADSVGGGWTFFRRKIKEKKNKKNNNNNSSNNNNNNNNDDDDKKKNNKDNNTSGRIMKGDKEKIRVEKEREKYRNED